MGDNNALLALNEQDLEDIDNLFQPMVDHQQQQYSSQQPQPPMQQHPQDQDENEEDQIIDSARITKFIKAVSKKYEHKVHFKQESLATFDKVMQSFVKTVLDQSLAIKENNNNSTSTGSSNANGNGKSTVDTTDIYRSLISLDLDFLLPSGGGVSKPIVTGGSKSRNDPNGEEINECLFVDDD
ncbi:hypothetical protein CYY_006348 [Polysphondylium violaceum]|uniref:Uncharacterized protein n=1 Tax=Polysphondylium violaceum TaxID=133409 RepID=A0A8J4PST3_9MYCE|nr:hypothetical protein CYY_006348 [Polysphondylium violaceum]